MMKTPTFIYSHDSIFQGVKEESSLFSKDKVDKDGNLLFENLVFDEAYLSKFRGYFFDAQAEVTEAISSYLKDIPVEPEYFEFDDFSKNRDYTFFLLLPENFTSAMIIPVNTKIRQFLIAYIMYRWLELKQIAEYKSYQSRSENLLREVKGLLDRRNKPVRIKGRLF
ncbi:MAG: hypothetical protein QM660_08815 [Dysgonomonas sp.]